MGLEWATLYTVAGIRSVIDINCLLYVARTYVL